MRLQYEPASEPLHIPVKLSGTSSSSSSSLLSSPEMSDAKVYAPSIRARLGTTAHFCEVAVLKLRTVPIGTAFNLRILRVRHTLEDNPFIESQPAPRN